MTTKLKFITENSWLVISEGDERVGLLTTTNDKYTLMVKDSKRRFASRDAVNEFFKKDVFSEVVATAQPTEVEKVCFISGYPADCSSPHEVLISGNTLPLYCKKESSNVFFSAGYYCLNFPKLWQGAYCPKFATLQAYDYLGPFTTKQEMKFALVKARKEASERNRQASSKNKEL